MQLWRCRSERGRAVPGSDEAGWEVRLLGAGARCWRRGAGEGVDGDNGVRAESMGRGRAVAECRQAGRQALLPGRVPT